MVDKKYFAFSQYSNTPMLQYSNNSKRGKKNEKGVHVGSALRLLFGHMKMGQDGGVELLNVFKVFGKNDGLVKSRKSPPP